MYYYIDKNHDEIMISGAANACGWTKCDSDSGIKKLSLDKPVSVRRWAYAKRNGKQDHIFAEVVGLNMVKFSLMPYLLQTKDGYFFHVGVG